jgi:hypothetical protein
MSLGRAVAVTAAVLCISLNAPLLHAEEHAAAEQIRISYEKPSDSALMPIYEALQKRQVLERLQGFLKPLRLPAPLTIRLAECGALTMPYRSGGPVTICYDMVKRIMDIAAKHTQNPAEQTLIRDGTFVQATLHQVAYAVFDQLKVPIWGREDDAADRVSALIMLFFGDRIALTTIVGTAEFFNYSQHTWTGAEFASEESPEAQRFYNYLCIAYGGDPLTFDFLRPRPGPSVLPKLPEGRAPQCQREYRQVLGAFNLRIMPFVDPDLMVKVRASQWLRPDEIPGGLQ